jgi:hypothetical protein
MPLPCALTEPAWVIKARERMKIVEIDLHGMRPADLGCTHGKAGELTSYIRQAWEKGETGISFIHGHGRNRGKSPGFVNTNTGYLGLCVRRALRLDTSLRRWIYHTTIDCSQKGCMWVRLKPRRSSSAAN